MDKEEKELLKKLLSKVENLEKEIKEMKEEGASSPKIPKFPPLPKTNDKLANIIVRKAREKLIREAVEGRQASPEKKAMEDRIREIRENFDLGEIALFALKKRLLKEGHPEEDGKSNEVVVIKEE